MKVFWKKLFLSLFLFLFIFCIFAFSVKEIWFKLDDLGVILNGIIKNFKDFIKVFSDDERNYIYPINFNVPKANFITGFYRPFQHIPFSFIYYFFKFNAYYYYLTNVFFHALNSVLFFLLISYFLPILSLSFFGGLLFAFYPILDWIAWISTLHNFLAIFFMFLSLIFYRYFLFDNCGLFKKQIKYFLAGLMFLFSIISRENTIFLGIWIFIGVFLFMSPTVSCVALCEAGSFTPSPRLWCTSSEGLFLSKDIKSFFGKIKFSVSKTYIFFLAYFIYFLLRLNAFGYKTLDRTLNSILLKFPFLKGLCNSKTGNYISDISVNTSKNISSNISTVIVPKINNFSWGEQIQKKIEQFLNCFWRWTENIFDIGLYNLQNKVIVIFLSLLLGIFLFLAYKKHKKIFIFLFIGVLLFSWPGVMAYPNPRYINAVYPFLIFIFLLGIYFYKIDIKNVYIKIIGLFFTIIIVLGAIFLGIQKNSSRVKNAAEESLVYKKKFANFFKKNKFNKDVNFIVVGSPFVSDIQNIFQVFLDDLKLRVAHVRASTLGQRGDMGCQGDYRIKGVKSQIERVNNNGKVGYRFISLEKEHCCWWMNFSFFPLKWSEEDRAYIWTDKFPEVGKWHDFSMGKFLINERIENKYITDIIFIFDDKWINENTVFVTWDTIEGKYKILD